MVCSWYLTSPRSRQFGISESRAYLSGQNFFLPGTFGPQCFHIWKALGVLFKNSRRRFCKCIQEKILLHYYRILFSKISKIHLDDTLMHSIRNRSLTIGYVGVVGDPHFVTLGQYVGYVIYLQIHQNSQICYFFCEHFRLCSGRNPAMARKCAGR